MRIKALNQLSDVSVKAASKPGRHSDGGGLYLNVSPSGTKSWLFMWTRNGKRREMGLGAYPSVGLARARSKAKECREAVEAGRDPIAERDKEDEPTFGKCADDFIAKQEKGWLNERHREQWKMTLGDAYCSSIRTKPVSTVDTVDVLNILNPIWHEKPETAGRIRGRIERVLDYAKTLGWRQGENPALWRGHLKNVLGKQQKLSRGHHAALPFDQIPAFVTRLRDAEAMAARALEFLILCASRSGEVYGAKWSEIDEKAGVWIIPAERMKMKKEHRVPLPKQAVALLAALRETKTNDFIFPGHKKDRPLSGSAMEMLLRRLKVECTVHGMRSSFRDWCGDRTAFSRELAEVALAHKVGDETERAYRRSDALEKRRKMMQAWADFCHSKPSANVIQMTRAI